MPSSVIKICRCAFHRCQSLTSVDLPSGLLEIGVESFRDCSAIETLHVPPTVTTIGECAFQDCSGLKYVKLPPTLKRIERRVFRHCGLNCIEIASSVSFIGERAFAECDSLTHIRIPPSVDRMMHWALEDCINLVSVELPEGISTPNVDMLLAVMKGGRLDHIIDGRDSFGSYPMDYLCLNRLPTSGDDSKSTTEAL
eukprot:scaffold18704_cov98-Cylindrotheca_fusiformis.AAC.1